MAAPGLACNGMRGWLAPWVIGWTALAGACATAPRRPPAPRALRAAASASAVVRPAPPAAPIDSGIQDSSPVETESPKPFVRGAVTSIVAYDDRACALFESGTAQCWGGFNGDGELGAGHTDKVTKPTWVRGLSNAASLSLGEHNTCAILRSGALLCWGRNDFLGDSDKRPRVLEPVRVPGFVQVAQVAIGEHHGCAVDPVGEVWCWGSNSEGQLGLGPATGNEVRQPTRVSGLSEVAGVALGRSDSYAWTRNGEVYRWGGVSRSRGRPGSPEPKLIAGVAGATRVVVEGSHACALLAGGTVRCWVPESMQALASGQQWDMGPEMMLLARALAGIAGKKLPAMKTPRILFPDGRGLTDATEVVVFNHDACALRSAGDVWCWGNSERSTLGRPRDPKAILGPTRIVGLEDVTAIAGGFEHRCALKKDGSVHCWGSGASGRMGNGRHDAQSKPAAVAGIGPIVSIAANDQATFAVARDGSVWCWGDNTWGACGVGSDEHSIMAPAQVVFEEGEPAR